MKRLITTFIGLFLFFVVRGQEIAPVIPEVIPPGPTAAELGRYGLVPVNMHTGNTNVSIPLYEFKTKHLSVPISLSYNSSAIHVDEVASWVGMHWSLNAGGVITRLVRSKPDRTGGEPYPENFGMYNAMSRDYMAANVPVPFDNEPDLFTYNFMGYSGKLVFDRDGTPVAMPRNDLVFQGNINNDFENGLTVTTPDGIKYSFGEIESTYIVGPGTGTDSYPVPTAWYLTRIEHPMGDVIDLTYIFESYGYPLSISSMMTERTNIPDKCNLLDICPLGSSISTTAPILGVHGKRLVGLSSPDIGSVNFEATTGRFDMGEGGGHKLSFIQIKNHQGSTIKSFQFNYVFSSNTGFRNLAAENHDSYTTKRMFLEWVKEMDKHENQVKKHTFEYEDINGLPARLSNSRDHWGYFNGESNSSPFPETLTVFNYQGMYAFPNNNANRRPSSAHAKKGLLKKITYPTGGSSEFSYEGNSYYGMHLVNPGTSYRSLTVSGVQQQYEDIVSSVTIHSGVDQTVRFNVSCKYQHGFSSTYGQGKWVVYNQQGNAIFGRNISVGETKTELVRLLANQNYTIAVIAEGPPPDGMWPNNTTTQMNFQYNAAPAQYVNGNIQTGGVRIASIKNHDPVTGKDETTNYHYARHDQLSQSSGRFMGVAPDYVTRYSFERLCLNPAFILDCKNITCSYVAVHSSGMNTLFRQNGNHIYYQYVTISKGTEMETGLEEHQFIVRSDARGFLVWGNNDVPGTPLSNTGWDNGLERAVRYFKKEGTSFTLMKKVENEYTKDNRYHREVPGLSLRMHYVPQCYYPPISVEILGKVFDAVQYQNISHWFYLSKQTVTTYDENGANPVVQETNYLYDNQEHTQLSRKVTTSSTGKTLETRYKYAKDYSLSGTIALMAGNSWNMNGIPIEQIQKVDGKVTAASATGYNYDLVNHFIAPTKIYRYETDFPGHGFSESTNGINFNAYKLKATIKYDDNGNIKEVTKEGDIPVSYIWGYGHNFPIAQVVNSAHDHIAFTSFESFNDNEGEWTFSGFTSSTHKKSGLRSHRSNSNITKSGLPSGNYIVSFWARRVNANEPDTRVTVTGSSAISVNSTTWTYFEVPFTGTSLTVRPNNVFLDDLRLYPVGAQMSTYTYDPPLGITSETDPNGTTIYYEYDDFGRLKFIRDYNGFIVQEFNYNYQH